MLETKINKITKDLCIFVQNGIEVRRAFDLLEAASGNTTEILAINVLRELYLER